MTNHTTAWKAFWLKSLLLNTHTCMMFTTILLGFCYFALPCRNCLCAGGGILEIDLKGHGCSMPWKHYMQKTIVLHLLTTEYGLCFVASPRTLGEESSHTRWPWNCHGVRRAGICIWKVSLNGNKRFWLRIVLGSATLNGAFSHWGEWVKQH